MTLDPSSSKSRPSSTCKFLQNEASFQSSLLKAYSFLLRRLTPNSGLTKLAFNSLTRRLFAGIEGPITALIAGDFEIEVDPDDYHGRILYLFGLADFKVSRTINALLREGDIFLDIGANYGSIGLSAVPIVGPTGRVHLFEPQPALAEAVEAAIARKGASEVVSMHRVALFDQNDTLELNLVINHSGMASLVGKSLKRHAGTVKVTAKKTYDYIHPLVGTSPFGVKIDIEGAEPQVLPDLLQLQNMRFWVFEGTSNKDWLFDAFSSADFVIFGLERSIFRVRLRPLTRRTMMVRYHDFLALRGVTPTSDNILSLPARSKLVTDWPGQQLSCV